ncbi:MAG TPA: alpha/beta fold hydrolase [Streptosporangiaceae bacterium]|nr:alpha/beta fold hydrolase [Streptosporangiaceae bacterium]
MPGLQETTVSDTAFPAPAEVLAAHRSAGRFFEAAGVRSFVRERGTGPAVVCVHGMIGSSFLYRKVLDELAGHGLRGVSFDLPGLGLAGRPDGYDYSWTGLGRFCAAAVDELGIGRFHLVVHDIGGPVGFELAAAMPHRILSLTMLNTTVDVTEFASPWPMRPFRHRGIGELWMRTLNRPAFRFLMRRQGIGDRSSVSTAELDTYLTLMKGPDRGRAFLQIMRSTERTPAKQARYRAAVRNVPYPVQAIWGADDPAMTLAVYGEKARAAAGLAQVATVPGKHFPQEDQAPAIARKIAEQALRAHPRPIGEE